MPSRKRTSFLEGRGKLLNIGYGCSFVVTCKSSATLRPIVPFFEKICVSSLNFEKIQTSSITDNSGMFDSPNHLDN